MAFIRLNKRKHQLSYAWSCRVHLLFQFSYTRSDDRAKLVENDRHSIGTLTTSSSRGCHSTQKWKKRIVKNYIISFYYYLGNLQETYTRHFWYANMSAVILYLLNLTE